MKASLTNDLSYLRSEPRVSFLSLLKEESLKGKEIINNPLVPKVIRTHFLLEKKDAAFHDEGIE
jgi:hypothetical protein